MVAETAFSEQRNGSDENSVVFVTGIFHVRITVSSAATRVVSSSDLASKKILL
jgi:hypothetical protein